MDTTQVFTTEDKEAIAYLKIDNLYGRHTVKWEWYSPDNKLYYSTGNYQIGASTDKYKEEFTTWHRLPIKNEKASNWAGNWRVKVYLDGKEVSTQPFTIESLAAFTSPTEKILPARQDAFAVVIGIDYKNRTDIPHLKYPSQDAQKVYETLTDPRYGGVPKENTILLLNNDATRNKIIASLGKIKNQDGYIYVYFSGHGAPKSEGKNITDAFLIPNDVITSSPDDMENTSISLSYLQKLIDQSSAKGIMVALDACFTGSGKSIVHEGGKPLVGMFAPKTLLEPRGTEKVVITSSATDQQSWEDDTIKSGIFSYYLLEGLKGKSGKGVWITVNEISDYIKDNVPKAAKKLKGEEQIPQVSGTGYFAVARNWMKIREIENAETKLKNAFGKGLITLEQLNRASEELKNPNRSKPIEAFIKGEIDEREFGKVY